MSCCAIGGNESPSTRISPITEAIVSIVAVTLIAIACVAFFYGNFLLAIGTVGLGGTISICEIVYRMSLCNSNKNKAGEEDSSRSETSSTRSSTSYDSDSNWSETSTSASESLSTSEEQDLNSSILARTTSESLYLPEISAIPNEE